MIVPMIYRQFTHVASLLAGLILLPGFAVLTALPMSAQDAPIVVDGGKVAASIPISLVGFSPDAERILEFDLSVVGFEMVKSDKAQYVLQSVPNDALAAALKDSIANKEMFRRAYPGGTRAQVHRLADEVVEAILRRPGIGGTRITYKTKTGQGSEVYIADFDGHNARQMTSDGTDVAAPAWGPGQRALYYTSYKLNNPDIFLHDLSTGSRTPVARYSGSNISPAPSPDGQFLAMILSKAGSPDLWVSDAQGGNARRLTTTKEDESSPCWSPDSRKICFTSRMDGRPALYVLPVSGGTPKKLTTGGVNGATEPDWSPDGKWIAFTRSAGKAFEICVVPADGGTAKVIREGEDPSWAPNSRTLVFVRRINNNRSLSLLDVPTNRVKDISSISGNCSQPSWGR